MSTIITPPKAGIPIGVVTINGKRVNVEQSVEFVRFFFDLMRRVGGTSSDSNAEILAKLEEVITELISVNSQLVALGLQLEDLDLALQALQAGEMTTQPMISTPMLDMTMQAGTCDPFGAEMTWQT